MTEIKTAVHAPVTGRGIPTNKVNPKNDKFLKLLLFSIDLCSHFKYRYPKNGIFLKNALILLLPIKLIIKSKIKAISEFPTSEYMYESNQLNPNPW